MIHLPLSPYVRESTKVLGSGSQPLDSGFHTKVDSGFQTMLWILDSSVWIPDSNSKNLLDSGFSYMGRPLVSMS